MQFSPGALSLAATLVRREIEQRYKGSFGGIAWYVIQTLLTVGIYSLVFGTIFSARWAEAGRAPASFALALFAGLLCFNLFSECIQRSTSLIVGNPTYVKKVVFPLEILPLVVLGASLFNMAIGLAVFFIFSLLSGVPPTSAILWVPLIVAPFALLVLGLMYFLASIGTFIRDTSHIVGPLLMAIMFLSPLFFPSDVLPEALRPFVAFNPLSAPMEMLRSTLIFGQRPSLLHLAVYSSVAVAIAAAGFGWFTATRKGFADVL